MASVGVSGGSMRVDVREGDGPVAVFLHYWGGSARTWSRVLDQLPGRATVAFDQRGWGRSAGLAGPYALDQLADDALRVVEELGLDEWVLVGHSMGGKVAQLVGGRRPRNLRGMVLVAPAPAVPAPTVTPAHQRELAAAYRSPETVAQAIDRVLTASPLSDPDRAQVVRDSLAGPPAAVAEWPLRGIATDIHVATANIAVPVRVVAGAADQVEPPGVLRANLLPHLRRGTLTEVPGAGHLLPLEAPAAVAGEVRELSE
jgi:pimeloyl-ACP methyl ester carboxylesterase